MRSEKLTGICVVAVIMIHLVFQIGCDFSGSKEKKDQEKKSFVEDLFLKPSERKIQLLAIKYQVSQEGIQYIIQDYLSSHDFFYKLMKKNMDKDNIKDKTSGSGEPTIVETVSMLSEKLGISEHIIASIIIDYEMWSAAEISGPADVE